MKSKMHMGLIGILCGLMLFGITSQAKATFIMDPDPGGAFFFIDGANKNVSSFTGEVGGQSTGIIVNVDAFANVDTGNGYANITPAPVPGIKPSEDQVLTKLIFTPENPDLFSDFSFRAQLLASGDVTITVVDNQTPLTFSFIVFENRPDQDFTRIGVVSLDGETIKSVTIESAGFKEVKQINFSGEGVVNVPEPFTLLLLGLGLVGVASIRRFRK